jgi:hypothetical protein
MYSPQASSTPNVPRWLPVGTLYSQSRICTPSSAFVFPTGHLHSQLCTPSQYQTFTTVLRGCINRFNSIQLIFPKCMDQEPVTSSGPALEWSPSWIFGLELKYGEREYLRAFLFLKAYSTYLIIIIG